MEVVDKKYDLRWRFDFCDGRIKYGKWSSPGETNAVKACYNNGEGLLRACIEGKNVFDPSDVRPLVDCDGHSFVNFKWNAAAFVPGNFKGTVQPRTVLFGLKLVTRDHEIDVFATGEVQAKTRSEEDKKFHYATFGR